VVLSRDEVAALLGRLRGTVWLMASLLYGDGLRLLECAELRVKDDDFERGELTIRNGKGGKAGGIRWDKRIDLNPGGVTTS
jgi:integrase